jgi:hypothetical protein
MPWEIPITIEGTTYPVRFNTEEEPSQKDIDEAVAYVTKLHSSPAAFGSSFELATVSPANANSTAGKVASSLGIAVCLILFLWFLKAMYVRKKLVISLLAMLCLFVAGYCFLAATASGGWHLTREGEASYTRPRHYSGDFYEGLRWSVMMAGLIIAVMARYCKNSKASILYLALAALFNPIFPLHLDKGMWQAIDALTAWAFIFAPGLAWPPPESEPSPLLQEKVV